MHSGKARLEQSHEAVGMCETLCSDSILAVCLAALSSDASLSASPAEFCHGMLEASVQARMSSHAVQCLKFGHAAATGQYHHSP